MCYKPLGMLVLLEYKTAASYAAVLVSHSAGPQKQRLSLSQHIARSTAVGAGAQPIHSLSAKPKTAAAATGLDQ